jgi:hypothetical protein
LSQVSQDQFRYIYISYIYILWMYIMGWLYIIIIYMTYYIYIICIYIYMWNDYTKSLSHSIYIVWNVYDQPSYHGFQYGLMAWMRTYPHDISGREDAVKASES